MTPCGFNMSPRVHPESTLITKPSITSTGSSIYDTVTHARLVANSMDYERKLYVFGKLHYEYPIPYLRLIRLGIGGHFWSFYQNMKCYSSVQRGTKRDYTWNTINWLILSVELFCGVDVIPMTFLPEISNNEIRSKSWLMKWNSTGC